MHFHVKGTLMRNMISFYIRIGKINFRYKLMKYGCFSEILQIWFQVEKLGDLPILLNEGEE